MRRLVVGVAAALGMWGPGLPVARGGEPAATPVEIASCVTTSRVQLEPGVTMNPAPFTFDEQGSATCQSPGGPLTATYSVRGGRGEGSCASVRFSSVPILFSWAGGAVTRGLATGATYGAVVVAAARLDAGRFAGGSYRFVAAVSTPDPTLCGSTGLRTADVHGSMTFSPLPAP